MPIESFSFIFEGNQGRADEQIVEIKGIHCFSSVQFISFISSIYIKEIERYEGLTI